MRMPSLLSILRNGLLGNSALFSVFLTAGMATDQRRMSDRIDGVESYSKLQRTRGLCIQIQSQQRSYYNRLES